MALLTSPDIVHPPNGHDNGNPTTSRMIALLVVWSALAAILLLSPSGISIADSEPLSVFCLVCGSRAFADALVNIAFFVPVGWLLAARWGSRRSVVAVLLLTLTIEIAQIWIPGRFPTALDVVWNLSGGSLGAWLFGNERRSLPVLAAGAVLAVSAPLALLAPAAPRGDYYGQWTARFGDMSAYEGQVLAARIDGIDVPSRLSERSEELRRALETGAAVEVRFVAGPPPEGLAPVFSVFDGQRRKIFLLGVDGEDAVLQRRTGASALRLDSPEIRWPGMLDGVEGGDTLDLRLTHRDRGLCLTIDERVRCETIPAVGAGWTLLLFLDGLSPPTTAVVGVLWTLLMGVLIGLPRGSPRLRLTLVGALTVVILALSANLPYMRGSLAQAVALGTGTVAGLLIRWRVGVR